QMIFPAAGSGVAALGLFADVALFGPCSEVDHESHKGGPGSRDRSRSGEPVDDQLGLDVGEERFSGESRLHLPPSTK
ncbi:uncharacterized protein METZ01_LOCUS216076, partial [marine metagenome]